MRIVLQRVTSAKVTVEDRTVSSIGTGYLLLLCVLQGDTEEQGNALAAKIVNVRLFPGLDGKINDRSILETKGDILVVSQFTLAGSLQKGNRPDYTAAADPQLAQTLYEKFMASLRELGVHFVAGGVFGAHMSVELTNDGPVTLLLER